jgi:flagellar basal-body rod protein FlgG
MIRGLYTSTSGMLKEQKKMDMVTNNIANVSTTGFKRDMEVIQSFDEVLTKRINDSNGFEARDTNIGNMRLGSDIVNIYTDFSSGTLMQTDNLTDISFRGNDSAFFVALSESGEELYTRNGCFTIDSEGYLVTQTGEKIVSANGPIYIGTDNFIVQNDGSIYVEGQYQDTFKIAEFEDNNELIKYGEGFWKSKETAVTRDFSGGIVQGFIEQSNVNSIEEMVKMIDLLRTYEANQRVLRAHDELLDKAVNQVGAL